MALRNRIKVLERLFPEPPPLSLEEMGRRIEWLFAQGGDDPVIVAKRKRLQEIINAGLRRRDAARGG